MAGHWAAHGHSVTLLTYTGGVPDHYATPSGVQRRRIDLMWDATGPISRLAAAVRRRQCLRTAILRDQVDVVVSFGDVCNVRVLLSCLGSGVSVVVSERTDPRRHALPASWRAMRRLLYPFASAVVVQTLSVAAWARQVVAPSRVHVIPNPVNAPVDRLQRPELLNTRRSVIAVGRLSQEKGFDILLHAFARARIPQSEWQLVIIGEGPERATLEAQVCALGLQDSVLMPGIMAAPDQWLQHAEFFVLSSRFEGFPNVLLEAMSYGLPVVALECPSGPAEIIQNEQTGLLVPPEDAAALASAIRRLALDSNLRRRLGSAAAVDVAHRFNLDRVGALWEALWADMRRYSMSNA